MVKKTVRKSVRKSTRRRKPARSGRQQAIFQATLQDHRHLSTYELQCRVSATLTEGVANTEAINRLKAELNAAHTKDRNLSAVVAALEALISSR